MSLIARQAAVYTMKSGSKMLQVFLYALAAVLVIYSVGLAFTSNFNMGNLMVWLLSAVVAICAIWHKPLHIWFHTSALGKMTGWMLLIAGGIYAVLIIFVSISGYTNPPTGQEKVMIVLGAGLRRDKPSTLLRFRLDKAYAYAAEHPDVLVITSGGQGRDEWVPEGQAMRTYLIEKGLDPERVIAENASTSTEENFAFSLELMQQYGYGKDTAIVYVSNAFHCYRAGRYAERAGFIHCTSLAAATPLRSILPCYLREALALAYYWVFKTSSSGPMHMLVGFLDLNKRFFYK